MIWIIFAVMTALVIGGLLWPALRRGSDSGHEDRNAYDRNIFRDQLAELDRDVERGTISANEAEAARNEISRRLIAAAAPTTAQRPLAAPSLAFLSALLIPAIAVPLYLKAGSPSLPDVPLATRLDTAAETGDMDALIAKVEQHLAKNPDDLQGWQVIAPSYRRAARWADAAEAQRNILRLSKPTAAALADYGEALVLANQGLISAEAHGIFTEALKTDAKHPKARFYDALALKQEGRAEEAKAAFEAFLAETPADAPWRAMLVAELNDMSSRPPALDKETLTSAENMTPEERQNMILSMVDGLEAKLEADGSDLEGWLKLIRARGVLGDTGKAKLAFERAKAQFKDNPEALTSLDGLSQELNFQ